MQTNRPGQGSWAPSPPKLEMQHFSMREIDCFIYLFIRELELSSITRVLWQEAVWGQTGAADCWQVACALYCGLHSAVRVFKGFEREL